MSLKIRILLVSIVFICSAIVIICNWTVKDATLTDQEIESLHAADDDHVDKIMYTSLILYAPMILDAIIEYIFQKDTAKEFSWPIHLFVAAFPNFFIYFDIIQPNLVPLVLYFQHTCLILLQEYRIQRLSSFQGVESKDFGKFFIFLAIACIFATLYNIVHSFNHHDHDSSNHYYVDQLRAITLSLTLVYHCVIIKGAYDLIKLSMKDSCIIRYSPTARAIFLANLMLLVTAAFVPFFDVVFYEDELILFPGSFHNNTILCGLIIASTTITYLIRCYENRLAIINLQNQFTQNRKMTRSISHEIRTPLNTAFMAIELLQDSMKDNPLSTVQDEENVGEWLETVDNIRDACGIALSILNQLLTFDKLSSNMLQLERHLLPILQVVESNAKLFRIQALQSGIHFDVDISSKEKALFKELHVFVDEHKINQVLRNFLSNAMKFTPRNGKVSIKLRLELYEDCATITTSESSSQSSHNSNKNSDKSSGEDDCGCGNDDFIQTHRDVIKELQESSKHKSTKSIEFIGKSKTMSRKQVPRIVTRNKTWLSSLSDTLTHMFIKPSYATIVPNDSTTTVTLPSISGTKVIGKVIISIIDTGPGVSKEDQAKLFQEYVQINPGELQKGQGSGLGLSIAKSIVAMHGGKVGMSSEGKNKGSTFFVELPVYHYLRSSGYTDLESATPSIDTLHRQYSVADVDPINNEDLVHNIENAEEEFDEIDLESGFRKEDAHKQSSHAKFQQKQQGGNHKKNSRDGSFLGMFSTGITGILSMNSKSSSDQHLQGSMNVLEKSTDVVCSKIAVDDNKAEGQNDNETSGTTIEPSDKDPSICKLVPGIAITPIETTSAVTAFESHRPVESSIVPSKRSPIHSHSHAAAVNPDRKRLNILIVDDSIANRKMLMRLLTRDGHRVFEASDGNEAVYIMKSVLNCKKELSVSSKMSNERFEFVVVPDVPIDVILMDNFMVLMNGPLATRLIRSMGFKRPILGITGSLDEEADEFLKSGVDLILQKPVDLKSLLKAFQSLQLI